mgnify:CR=1 FL=1
MHQQKLVFKPSVGNNSVFHLLYTSGYKGTPQRIEGVVNDALILTGAKTINANTFFDAERFARYGSLDTAV